MIWTMTTIRHLTPQYRKDGTSYEWRPHRTVGYMDTFEEADELVRNNVMDLNEANYYPYAVIEAFGPGIYPYMANDTPFDNQTWYLWNKELELYEKLDETPEEFKQIIGWGLG